MPRPQFQELAMKIDADETLPERSSATSDASAVEETQVLPGLRPEVLGDAPGRRTRALVFSALFPGPGEAPTVGPYQVLKRLGEGGMGVVYAAYDDKLERKVALKLIRGEALRGPEGRARTLREARALARLSHPNVVHVYQVGEVEDEIYVAMEFLTGPTLQAWLGAQPRAWREVLAVFRQAGDGLAAAHRQGVIHRDFKPANVIVGDDGRVRVLDFGLAHFSEEGEARALVSAGQVTDVLLTQTGAVLGTPAYMAAEQFAGGRGDAKTDQYSFCAALYEALYGQRPFVGDRLETLASAVQAGRVEPVRGRHEVPVWLHRVVMRGLQPDPEARWPSMEVVLTALHPPETRARSGRLAGLTGAAGALLLAGVGYGFLREAPALPAAAPEAGQGDGAVQAELLRSRDASSLAMARAALVTDPLLAIRLVSMLAGDDEGTWQQARFIADAAAVRGLPAQVMRADRNLAAVWPLGGGGLIGRDDLGAVWQWDMSEKTGTQIFPAGSATQMAVARDVPVWAMIAGKAARVFGGGREQVIELDDFMYSGWRLTPDGETLVASAQTGASPVVWVNTVYLWDLTRPGSTPRTISPPAERSAVVAEDASVVLVPEAGAIRVVRPGEGTEKLLRYRGQPQAVSADGRFAIAEPEDGTGVRDVIEVSTGKTRRVQADSATVLAADEVLFTRMLYGRAHVRRESLASGAVAWSLPLPLQAGSSERHLVVDPAGEQFAAAVGESWVVGDLRRGGLGSFVTLPKDSAPLWVGADALMAVTGSEARIYRPSAAPVQVRASGSGCGLAADGRWGVVLPEDWETGEITRVELATRRATSFRCPKRPRTEDGGGRFGNASVAAYVDGAGQVAMFDSDGWSCWWDEQHGARLGPKQPRSGVAVALPRGVARAEGGEVSLWSGPGERAQWWVAAASETDQVVGATVKDMVASPTGALLAARSEAGVKVLHVDSGAAVPVPTWSTPSSPADVMASALAWSPDGARLAVLDKVDGSLELSVWDVLGEPREVSPQDHVTLGGHVLKSSPGRPRNLLSFTPSGATVALTHRHESLMLVDLASHETRQMEAPDLLGLRMISETDAVGVDLKNTPFVIDFAARQASPLAPNIDLGGSTRAPIVEDEGGSVWTCAALGPGTLIETAAAQHTSPQALRGRLLDLAASL